MRSFTTWMRLIRLPHCLAIAAATWAASLYSGGPFDHAKQAAVIIVILLTAGASLLHYSHHVEMYLRKGEYWVTLVDPALMRSVAFLFWAGSIAATLIWLRQETVLVLAVMALAALYTWFFSRHWQTKTLTILAITLSPFAIGWLAGNKTGTFPWFPFITIGCLLAARELIKDVQDVGVDEDEYRATSPLRFSVDTAESIANSLMAICMLPIMYMSLSARPPASWLYATVAILTVAAVLFQGRKRWLISTDMLFTAIGCTVAGMIASVLVP